MSTTIRTTDILHCLPLLASILGKRYGVKVIINGDITYTDGQTICLPSLPLDSDETLLEQVRGYIDHESSHIRYTNFGLLARMTMDPVWKHIMNIIEDWRVENAMSDVFPGCRANLNKLIPYLIPEPFTAPDKPGTAILIAILRTVRRWDLPTVQTADCMAFVNHHFPGLWPRIQNVLDKVCGQCASTEAAIAYAQEIMDILQRYCQTPPKAPQKQNPPSDASASAHERSESPSETTAQNAQGAQDHDASDSHPKAGGTGGTEQSGLTQDNSFTTGVSDQMSFSEIDKTDCAAPWNQTDVEALLNSRDAELPKITGEFLRDALQKTCRKAHSYDKISVSKVKTKWTRPLLLMEMAETKRATTALRTRLQSLLQASVLKRSRPSQRGRLNASKLYRGMIHDPKLFLHREEKQSLNTAVHILLDSRLC